ncbi:bifunctional folylpolyglutamate synthase/dihydrofolate synthase [Candidatus Gottesmanbacteria bacterium]|nr:bifunctional folylpolyglutamate synthase/dihydrofolate synthase [Candidatus Gottesmanbacteria bacterium]
MIDSFPAAVKFLENYIPDPTKKFPGELGLLRMRTLMEFLGNPQDSYPTIHVGGTSGKGSAATLIASILSQKYIVGLHTSPHLVSIRERIKIFSKNKQQVTDNNKNNISEEKFVHILQEVISAIQKLEKSELGKPSYFEVVTAMAFLAFQREEMDMAVIEVGMGGKFDATNVVKKPLVAVLTNIGLDHTEVLGDTVEKIAVDKSGIIKSAVEVVSGVTQPSVIKIIETSCREKGAHLSLLGRDFSYSLQSISEGGSVFDYQGKHSYANLNLTLQGSYQIENAAIGIRCIEVLPEKFSLSESQIRNGLKNATIAGRFEILSKKPLIILDGAHNEDKIRALMSSLRTMYPKKTITTLLAIKNDKRQEAMLRVLLLYCKKIILTKFSLTTDMGETLSFPPEELKKTILTIDPTAEVQVLPDVSIALQQAKREIKRDLLLITGSLYLVGEVKKVLSI